jgi:hypothetical protein
MEEKDRDARPPAATFFELCSHLCDKLGLSSDTATTQTTDFLRLIRLTAGNQYEDYLSIVLNVQESSELVVWICAQLAGLHAQRSPSAKS